MQFVQSLVLQPEELKTLIHAEQPELGRFLDQLEASSALFFNLNTIGLMLVKEELAVEQLSIPVDRGVSGDLRFGVLIAV